MAVVLMLDLAVAWARVLVGPHFPLDMVGVAAGAYAAVMPLRRTVGEPCAELAERRYRVLLARVFSAGWMRG